MQGKGNWADIRGYQQVAVTAVLVRRSTASIIVSDDQPRLGIFETKHHFFAGVRPLLAPPQIWHE